MSKGSAVACGRVCGEITFRWSLDRAARECAQADTPGELLASWARASEHIDCPGCFPGPWLGRAEAAQALDLQGYQPIKDSLGYGLVRAAGGPITLAEMDKSGGHGNG